MDSDTNKPLTVIFLTLVPFPYGMAQTNRLISMARGLARAGSDVRVICLKPTETKNSKNIISKGKFEEVEFFYSSGTVKRGKNLFIRIYNFIFGCINATAFLLKQNRKNKIDFVFIGVVPLILYTWFFVLCKLLHIKYIQERSEYPFIKSGKSIFDPVALKIYLKLICKYFDGFIVITEKLRDYYKPHLRKGCHVFKLPILVESERFRISSINTGNKYIAYCGSMQGNKDGVPDLIESYALISHNFPDVKLALIGSTNFIEFNNLKVRISELFLDRFVLFTGEIDRDELPIMLANAMLLVLARPESPQAEGGFPTKLGEYLATGKPVLVTDVGEINLYLKDGVNAYIAPPGNPEQFALKMKSILDNYEQALNVGSEGRRLSQTIFNYMYQGKLLNSWLNGFFKING